jgi:4-azaleucine resistance transporter AzlC
MTIAAEIRAGLTDVAAPSFAAVPIGLLFGAVAVSKGLSPAEVALMSAMVFAGGAQFAAIEQWVTPAPIAALAFGTLLINARHILMGASLAPKTGAFRPWQRFVGFFAMADENWALSERRAREHRLTPAYYLAMTLFFYLNWQVWSTLGALIGPLLGDPARLGADFAFTALFIGLVAGFWQGRVTAATILASGIASALVKTTIGAPWHVPAGAIAGIAAAYLAAAVPKAESQSA